MSDTVTAAAAKDPQAEALAARKRLEDSVLKAAALGKPRVEVQPGVEKNWNELDPELLRLKTFAGDTLLGAAAKAGHVDLVSLFASVDGLKGQKDTKNDRGQTPVEATSKALEALEAAKGLTTTDRGFSAEAVSRMNGRRNREEKNLRRTLEELSRN